MATPPDGTKLSLGKLGRATAVGNSNYTSKTSLNDAGRDSGTGKTSLGDFYLGAVDTSLDGFQYVDEATNETYEVTFTNSNTLFDSRIKTRAENFTWTTNNASLFNMNGTQDFTTQYNAGAISDLTSALGSETSFVTESNLVLNHQYRSSFASWSNSGGDGIAAVTSIYSSDPPSTSPSASAGGFEEDKDNRSIQFKAQNAFVTQSLTVKGNSTYQLRAIVYSSATSANQIRLQISGAYEQQVHNDIIGSDDAWYQFRQDFYTSGSSGVNQTLELRFTASAHDSNNSYLDSVYFERWEGANFSDQEVTISGKYHDDRQSDGFNDHATRYNTAIQKTVEIQDTYGGLSSACFLPGTMILMSDGSEKDIEYLNVGDEVMSINLPGLPDEDLGRDVWMPFTMDTMDNDGIALSEAFVESLFYDFEDGYYDINNGEIKVTKAHEFWVYTNGLWRWKRANELLSGMKLYQTSGKELKISSIEWVGGDVEVIQFDVEPLDVYFAGGVLVHNKGTESDPA